MRGSAYYNEIDPFAAAWLRELIAAGHIAPGVVDERDIRDVRPDDLAGYVQCHFFAGIGVWSYALRRAGWSDDQPVWTASLPCQPWSDAGKGGGFGDERHLWPTFNELRLAVRPVVVLGEQVASKDGLAWLDAVQADVEGSGDAFGAVDLCSAGFGAPHIRQRLHWLAVSEGEHSRAGLRDIQSAGDRIAIDRDGGAIRVVADAMRAGRSQGWPVAGGGSIAGRGGANRLDDADDARLEGFRRGYQAPIGRIAAVRPVAATSEFGGVGDANSDRPSERRIAAAANGYGCAADTDGGADRAAPTNGFWRNADWLGCRDGKWRPVEPGTFPLAHGAAARVGRLRGYGNAINAEVATGFIEAVIAHLRSSETGAA